MGALTEVEILDRHAQALGEAHQACQRLGRNADPEYLAPRSRDYGNLKRALQALEGSARQMGHFRADGRWFRLGIVYAKAMRVAQAKFVGQRWAAFNEMMKLFDIGFHHLDELKNGRTGATGPILPKRASEWLILPDHRVPMPPPWRGTTH